MQGPHVYLLCRIHGDHVGDIIVFPDGKVSGIANDCRKCMSEIVFERRDFLTAIRKAQKTGKPIRLGGYPKR
jgi:hypothetical protein